jgi:signal transduction histidine kinase
MKLGVVSRLHWFFASMLIVALGLVVLLSCRDMELERAATRFRKAAADPSWWRMVEMVMRSAVPLAIFGVGTWWLAVRTVRPLQSIAQAAQRMHVGRLQERIPLVDTAATDEFASLAVALNDMSARLTASFERLTMAAGSPETLQMKPVKLDLLVRNTVDEARVLNGGCPVKTSFSTTSSIVIQGDPDRLRELLLILCDSAARTAAPGAGVSVDVKRDAGKVLVCVRNADMRDAGGAHENHAPQGHHITLSTETSSSSSSLGLAIASWIACAHEGSLSRSVSNSITEFVLTLPA